MKYAKWISVLMLLTLPAIATAQLQSNQRVVANVPFTFVVANTVIPLGECAIQPDPTGKALEVRHADARIRVFATTSAGTTKAPAVPYSLIFRKYGRRYFLVAMTLGDSGVIYRFSASKYEQELLAQNSPPTEKVLLASLR